MINGMIDDDARELFRTAVWDYYRDHGRHDLPWRLPDADGFDAYKILVSELMLQQTQVGRVVPKYHEFLEAFPTVIALAAAPLYLLWKASITPAATASPPPWLVAARPWATRTAPFSIGSATGLPFTTRLCAAPVMRDTAGAQR